MTKRSPAHQYKDIAQKLWGRANDGLSGLDYIEAALIAAFNDGVQASELKSIEEGYTGAAQHIRSIKLPVKP
jgi:hypothetical protein